MTDAPHLLLNDRRVALEGVDPRTTLLDWLRGPMALRGTKEGCAEGDCGACTVLWERPDGRGGLERRPVNACLASVGQFNGRALRSIEGLAASDGSLHPVQQALADSDGTQCGFCTPGFVMAIAGWAAGDAAADDSDALARLHDALAGNLCRCTGYRPIVAAALACRSQAQHALQADAGRSLAALQPLSVAAWRTAHWHAPASLDELLHLRATLPQAMLLAGGTDLGLLASRDRAPPPQIIAIGHLAELQTLHESADSLEIGAALPYADLLPAITRHWPSFADLLRRLGSQQIRNLGTLGGNLGTASPIGDGLPPLLALDAELTLASRRGRRTVPIDGFFTGYRRTAMAGDEILLALRLKRPQPGEILVCDKVSKRRDQDIASVCSAFRLKRVDGVIAEVRLAFGGMAATPARAPRAEAALQGQRCDPATLASAQAALAEDFQPRDDLRGSAAWRMAVAQGLLQRLWLQLENPDLPIRLEAL